MGAYNMRAEPVKGITTRIRTGQAVIQGLIDTHPRNQRANAVRLQQLEATNVHWEQGISHVALRSGVGRRLRTFTSRSRARAIGEELHQRTGQRWRPVRLIPWGGHESQLQHLLDTGDNEGFVLGRDVNGNRTVDHPISQAIEDAVSGKSAGGHGPWVLVPEEWAARVEAHAQVYRSVNPMWRAINGAFRHTVLPLSLPWLQGNVAEATLRAAVQSPRILHNLITYRRVIQVLERIDPQAAAYVKAHVGTGLFGSMEATGVHVSAEHFSASSSPVLGLVKAVERIFSTRVHGKHLPRGGVPLPPEAVAMGYRAWTHFVFNHVNGMLESPLRKAMAGHHIRMEIMDSNRALRNTEKAVTDAAQGLRNTPAQHALGDAVRRAYGQYESWDPRMRKVILTWSPFVPWAVNAVRFLTQVLPQDHPLITALLAAQDTWHRDWVNANLPTTGKGSLPHFLWGSVPTPGGGHLRAARYTPFGVATDPLDTLTSEVAPQLSGLYDALQGRDWTGRELKNSDGSPYNDFQRIMHGAAQVAGSTVPGFNLIQRTIGAPGPNIGSKLWYVQNPARPVAPKKKTKGGKSKSPSERGAVKKSKSPYDSSGTVKSTSPYDQ